MTDLETNTVEISTSYKDKDHKPTVIFVKVVTTSGTFPRHGYEREKPSDLVSKLLRKVAHALHLTDVSTWVATVEGQEIDPEKTYAENGLTETVTIQWGPKEGGGGYF